MVKKQKKMLVFDVDGVMLDVNEGSFKEIIKFMGKEKEIKKIDQEYQKRKEKGPWGLDKVAKLFKNSELEYLRKIAQGFVLARFMKGINLMIEKAREKKYIVGAISANPEFVLEVLKDELSLDFVAGTRLEVKDGFMTGKILRKIDRYGKAELLEEKIKEYKVKPEFVVVVGNSITDLPMSEKAGKFIAFNSNEELLEKADVLVKDNDLSKLIPHL